MRKPQSQPSFAGLTEAEREQLADWVRREEYAVVRDRANQPRPEGFGLNISDKPLRTLWAKVALLDLINSRLPADKRLTLAEFESLASRDIPLLASFKNEKCKTLDAPCSMNESSAEPCALSDPDKSETKNQKSEITGAIHDTILNTVHDLATSGENTVTQLLALQRLADFPARLEIREQRLELDNAKFTHKQGMDQFRKDMAEKRFNFAEKTFAFRQQVHEDKLNLTLLKAESKTDQPKKEDPLGPKARNWKDIGKRVRIKFNISDEESERRRALRKAWREEQAKLTAQPLSDPASSVGGAARAASGSPVAAVCDRRSASSPPPNENPLNLIDFLKDLTTEFDAAPKYTPTEESEINPANPVQDPSPSASPMPNENCSMLNAQWNSTGKSEIPSPSPVSSASSVVNASAHPANSTNRVKNLSLLDRVNQYNLARNREAEHGKNPHKVGKWNAWNFKSKMQWCPCGHRSLPCPQHGWFPPEFFELSCDSADYWAVLDAKKLPYTPLCHIDAAERDRLESMRKFTADNHDTQPAAP